MTVPLSPERLADLSALHDSLPLNDPDRHNLEDPQLEDAFEHLASDHPDRITYDPNWTPGGAS